MAAVTATYAALPPTSNILDGRQRARLIRSTRKLGAVLGTTPQLLEDDDDVRRRPFATATSPPARDRKRRQGSIFEFSAPAEPFAYNYASSSSSSLSLPRTSLDSNEPDGSALPVPKSFSRHVREKSLGGKGKRTPQLPTPLVLRLNAVPLPPSDPRVRPPTPDTAATLRAGALAAPGSRSPALPVTPTTPRTPVTPTATETRRKRLAKLKRTLGENVPIELVVPRRRGPRSGAPSPVEPPRAPQSAPTLPEDRLASSSATSAASRPPPKSQRPTHAPRGTRRRSMSMDTAVAAAAAASAALPALEKSTTRPSLDKVVRPSLDKLRRTHARTPSTSTSVSPPAVVGDACWQTGSTSWTGEWNRKDIREVQSQLRNLRLR